MLLPFTSSHHPLHTEYKNTNEKYEFENVILCLRLFGEFEHLKLKTQIVLTADSKYVILN
jgi:hypothetical protein